MSNLPLLLNSLFLASAFSDALFYRRYLPRAGEIQRRLLLGLLRRNRATEIGRRFKFGGILDVRGFQRALPVMSYEDYLPYIDRIREGASRVLTEEPVLLFELTGGTTSGSKLVPYTRSLKREYQRSVNPWIWNLYTRFPSLLQGTCYWSISPVGGEREKLKSAVPVGFETDADYLGRLGRLLERSFCVPAAVRSIRSMENFRYVTALFLLRDENLALISVWHPSFLLLILETTRTRYADLVRDIRDGRLSLPETEDYSFLDPFLRPDPQRSAQIEARASAPFEQRLVSLWPRLRVVSCWRDGTAAKPAEELGGLLPQSLLQAKGLVATEGIVSIPLVGVDGTLPAYSSHFLEFLTDGGEAVLLEDLEVGGEYGVLLTTGGGFYRYTLGDRILVTGRHLGLPLIRFLGREATSDLVGEKIHFRQGERIVEELIKRFDLHPTFALLAPEISGERRFYSLFLETLQPLPARVFAEIQKEIENRLSRNFQYAYARRLGQLEAARLVPVAGNSREVYYRRCSSEGQVLGAIKQHLFDVRPGWSAWFNQVDRELPQR